MPRGRKAKSPIFKAITEIRDYISRLDEEIAAKQAERDELQRALGIIPAGQTMSSKRTKSAQLSAAPESGGKRGKRMPRKEMQAALETIQGALKKGEEYTREQVAAAAKIAPQNVQSMLIRAKAKKILKSNGQRGRGGRWMLA